MKFVVIPVAAFTSTLLVTMMAHAVSGRISPTSCEKDFDSVTYGMVYEGGSGTTVCPFQPAGDIGGSHWLVNTLDVFVYNNSSGSYVTATACLRSLTSTTEDCDDATSDSTTSSGYQKLEPGHPSWTLGNAIKHAYIEVYMTSGDYLLGINTVS